jgi:RNA polymerase sigma-70 factor (ECF subfamily)
MMRAEEISMDSIGGRPETDKYGWLAERFEIERPHLRAVAYQLLGSLGEAEDATQEAWLHLCRSDSRSITNLRGWLTTVVARICLDILRTRASRHEELLEGQLPDPIASREEGMDPEQVVLLAESVGLALQVVLDTLEPAERVAFVLHDIFTVPFDEIASLVGRSEPATRQLASRARRRVREATRGQDTDLVTNREVVDAFFSASRDGDFAALLTLLDPDVVLRADRAAVSVGAPEEVRGAASVANRVAGRVRGVQPALVNGAMGAVARRGRQVLVFCLMITGGKIAEINVIADPEHLRHLDLVIMGSSC